MPRPRLLFVLVLVFALAHAVFYDLPFEDAFITALCVICDVNMPRMSGLDFLDAIKKDGQNANLPVLMLTTEGQPQLVERAKGSGAKGWVVKPFPARSVGAKARTGRPSHPIAPSLGASNPMTTGLVSFQG